MKPLELIIVLIFVGLMAGCAEEWKESGRFISALKCGMDKAQAIEIAKNNNLKIKADPEFGNLVAFQKGDDYIMVSFNKENNLVSILKPQWTFTLFG